MAKKSLVARITVDGLMVNVLLTLLSTALTLIVAEALLRGFQSKRTRMFRFSPSTIYELTANSVRSFTHIPLNGGHTVWTRINSAGFRGDELRQSPERRVVVYGDSFIQGEFSTREATFVMQLGDRLKQRCPWDIEMVNAGVIGFGPDQILRKMENELPDLQPDIVIVAVFADNDFGDLMRNKMFFLSPQGELEENALHMTDSLERALGVRKDFALVHLAKRTYWHWLDWRRRRRESFESESRISTDSSFIDKWLQEAMEQYSSYIDQGDFEVRSIDYDFYDADISLLPGSTSAQYKIRLMKRILARIDRYLSDSGTDRTLVIIPSPIDICKDYGFQVDVSRFPKYDRRALSRSFEQGAEECRMPYISLWEVFESNQPCSLFFQEVDNHWNDLGQALAAEAVANTLIEDVWTECR